MSSPDLWHRTGQTSKNDDGNVVLASCQNVHSGQELAQICCIDFTTLGSLIFDRHRFRGRVAALNDLSLFGIRVHVRLVEFVAR